MIYYERGASGTTDPYLDCLRHPSVQDYLQQVQLPGADEREPFDPNVRLLCGATILGSYCEATPGQALDLLAVAPSGGGPLRTAANNTPQGLNAGEKSNTSSSIPISQVAQKCLEYSELTFTRAPLYNEWSITLDGQEHTVILRGATTLDGRLCEEGVIKKDLPLTFSLVRTFRRLKHEKGQQPRYWHYPPECLPAALRAKYEAEGTIVTGPGNTPEWRVTLPYENYLTYPIVHMRWLSEGMPSTTGDAA